MTRKAPGGPRPRALPEGDGPGVDVDRNVADSDAHVLQCEDLHPVLHAGDRTPCVSAPMRSPWVRRAASCSSSEGSASRSAHRHTRTSTRSGSVGFPSASIATYHLRVGPSAISLSSL